MVELIEMKTQLLGGIFLSPFLSLHLMSYWKSTNLGEKQLSYRSFQRIAQPQGNFLFHLEKIPVELGISGVLSLPVSTNQGIDCNVFPSLY